MLINLLTEIAGQQANSFSSLAKKLDLDREMIKQMLNDLQRLGYLTADNAACVNEQCKGCGGCCSKGNGEAEATLWTLTAKGRVLLESTNR
ncbi:MULTISPECIES: FeoC-like transcriptional regulator [unclassified Dehalobacter]|uniref:FeoC-like transcriptional regulator n=1 Tax=unclassified Dehalobacter TaxID=2635733 RepID=UPI000E6C2FD0|nr:MULTISPECIES: FeoC-like transcriptional regulator [unclassified Dehalobacter]RJE48233.1 transcriptional regulator [Dehalobacter sp. MCB1]TCX49712.1 transcriptional regulator [Dehalobacter sp. 14DCB1]TCX50165.1 transcriptional regulator [Dehalobacter sp. 12DCB1]